MRFLNHRVEVPTYAEDVVGKIGRWDERDILFARSDLFEHFDADSAEFRAYYAAHPAYLEIDTKINAMPALGRHGGVDCAMFEAQFGTLTRIGTEAFVDGEPASVKTPLSPGRAAEKVKAFARLLGADLVGVGPLRQQWVYTHVGRSREGVPGYLPRGTPIDLSRHKHAIALGFAMDRRLVTCAPDFPVLLASGEGYARGAWVSVQLAAYIRRLGYAARAHHFRNYQVLTVPVAVDCGLGELSRAGYLLTKELGLGVRLAVVTTELPLAHDRPLDIGVQSFCETCKICAEVCPVKAIPSGEKVVYNGVRKWVLDATKCYRYWHAVGTDCGLCMAACPWTKPPTFIHRVAAELASVSGPHQRWMTWADKLIYGPHRPAPPPFFLGGDPA